MKNKPIPKGTFLLAVATLLGFWPTVYNLLHDDKIAYSNSYAHALFIPEIISLVLCGMLFWLLRLVNFKSVEISNSYYSL